MDGELVEKLSRESGPGTPGQTEGILIGVTQGSLLIPLLVRIIINDSR